MVQILYDLKYREPRSSGSIVYTGSSTVRMCFLLDPKANTAYVLGAAGINILTVDVMVWKGFRVWEELHCTCSHCENSCWAVC